MYLEVTLEGKQTVAEDMNTANPPGIIRGITWSRDD